MLARREDRLLPRRAGRRGRGLGVPGARPPWRGTGRRHLRPDEPRHDPGARARWHLRHAPRDARPIHGALQRRSRARVPGARRGGGRAMKPLTGFNLWSWIEQNRHAFEPPVGNKVIWEDSQFTAMIICGPNPRRVFTVDPADQIISHLVDILVIEHMHG